MSGSRTPSTSAGRRASPQCSPSSSTRSPNGHAVLNADDAWTPWLAARTRRAVETVGYGRERRPSHHAMSTSDERLHAGSRSAAAASASGSAAHTRSINAAMAAVTAQRAFGVEFGETSPSAWKRRGDRAGGWSSLESADGVVVLNDAYNANPSSMDAALRALAQLGVDGRRIAVLGDMRELGDHSAGAHEASAGSPASSVSTCSIGVGDGGAEIAGESRRGYVAVDVRTVADADEAAALVVELCSSPAMRCSSRRAAGQLRACRRVDRIARPTQEAIG